MTLTLNPTQAETAALYVEVILTPRAIAGKIRRFLVSLARAINPDAFHDLRVLEDLREKLKYYGYEYDRRERRLHHVPYPIIIPDEMADSLYFMLLCSLSNPPLLHKMAVLSLPDVDPAMFVQAVEGLRDRLERHLVQIGRFSADLDKLEH